MADLLMVKTTQRLDIKLINHELFTLLMTTHGYTVRSLTDAVNDRLRAAKPRTSVRATRSVIGHLRSGHRSACKPEIATAIAGLFKLPVTALFSGKVSNVRVEVAA